MQERRYAVQEGCRTCGMHERRDAGQVGFRSWDAGQVGCITTGTQDRRDAGKEGCRNGNFEFYLHNFDHVFIFALFLCQTYLS